MSEVSYTRSPEQQLLTIQIEGEFSYGSYDDFMRVLHQFGPESKQVVLDFSELSHIDAYGVGLLLLLIDYISGRASLSVINSNALSQQALLRSHLDRYMSLSEAV